MSTLKRIKNIEWIEDLERENTIFYISIYHEAYGPLLLKGTGFYFQHQLCLHDGRIGRYYKSKKEREKASAYFLELVKQKNPKIQQLYEQCKIYLKKEKELIKKFSKINNETIVKDYGKIISECKYIFMYLTNVPLLILSALEGKESEFQITIDLFQEFRKTSRIGFHELVLEKIWKAAKEYGRWKNYIDFSYFTTTELGNMFKNKEYPSKEEIEKRKKGCAFYKSFDKTQIFFYENNFSTKIRINLQDLKNLNEVKGISAYKGCVKGRVCIINRMNDMKKFQEGDVIISINSNPSLMPVLSKCKGIVTNEGGLICHAAVIARELNIPCIIGTKVATRIFHDGDMVEVNADKGIIKKI